MARQALPIGALLGATVRRVCSSVLLALGIVATTGHCVESSRVRSTYFLLGYRMLDATQAATTLTADDVYRGRRVIGREETDDAPVPEHRPRPIRRREAILEGEPVHVIGHPRGL